MSESSESSESVEEKVETKNKELNPIAKEWLVALRSGEYKQAKGALHRGDEHCCLGVLECLALKAGVITILSNDRVYLTDRVMNWAGLNTSYGKYGETGFRASLSWENDHDVTFSQIADIIESKPEGLFAEGR